MFINFNTNSLLTFFFCSSRDLFVEISHLQGLVHSLEAQLDRQKMELTSQLKMRHSDLVHELYGNAFKLKGTVVDRFYSGESAKLPAVKLMYLFSKIM